MLGSTGLNWISPVTQPVLQVADAHIQSHLDGHSHSEARASAFKSDTTVPSGVEVIDGVVVIF